MVVMTLHVLCLLAWQLIWPPTGLAQLVFEDAGASDTDPYYVGESANVSRLLDSLLKGYDKRLRPNYKGPPVEVGISMFVSSVSSISEVDMDFTLDMYFRQIWRDPRLNFSDSESQLCISNEMLAKMWWPDTFFANAKASKFHHTTTKNAFLRIKPSGLITQSLRLTVTAMCNMNLMYFPMDFQICSLEIESYGYNMDDIVYNWVDGQKKSVSVDPAVKLPTFTVRGIRMKERVVTLSTGNYSRMSCEFFFGRSLGYYIIHIYIPSTLIVVLSWVSFWLNREAVPARVALGITTVLTMTTLISSTNAALPKISYLKSIDIFLLICFVMVFASLLEYAAVSYLANKCKRKQKRRNSDAAANNTPNHGVKEPLTNAETYPTARSTGGASASGSGNRRGGGGGSCMCCAKPSLIDKWSRVLFPLVFGGFNTVYWVSYQQVSTYDDKDNSFVWLE